jgi:DNA-binding SARP family transcriptional activator/tetratricopeptide (TPR) repeat protein
MSDPTGVHDRTFRLCCLGPPVLHAPGGAKVLFRTRKHTALLLLLARRPGVAIPKSRLLDLLWSDDEEASARHSLSQSVSLVNKALGCEAIGPAGRDQLSLRDGLVWLDLVAFEQHLRAGRPRDARGLWRGNLLEGCPVRRAPRFEEWVESERQRLARAMREVLSGLLEAERSTGEWGAMRELSEELLALDPLDEGAMLALLEVLVLTGDRTGALRRYHEFEAQLRADLGAQAGPRLRAWAQRHRQGQPELPPPGPSVPARVSETALPPAAQPVFGRHEEFAALWEAWESARSGQGACVLLHGPAGIGKSALAGKLANQVHVSGGAVCLVRCFRSEKSVPFAPVSALVRQLSRLPGFVALSPMVIGELSRLVPELRERFPDAPQPMAIDDSARYRLCDATLRAAECVADEQPLLLVADDLQDADEATLALLHYFGRQASSQPTVLVGIHRTPSGDADFDRAFVDTARSAGFARPLALGALAEEAIVRIVLHIFARRGLDAPPDLLARLADAAAGNPLQAIELSLAIPAQGGRPEATWLEGLEDGDGSEGGAFEQTADERLAQLPEEARKVAGALALAGRPLTDYDLAAVTHLPTSSLASALLALEAAQFVRRGETTLAFTHERYRARAEAAIPAEGRRAVHRALARYLASSAAGNPAARYEVASHYAGAGRPAEARTHALAAARYAGSIGALRERSAALELARSVADGYDGRLAADLGSCYLDLKEFDRLDALCAEAGAHADLDRDLRDEFRYLAIAADHHAGRAPLRQVQTALEALVAAAGAGFARAADAHNLLMRTADKTGDHRAVKRAARELRRRPAAGDRGRRSAHALFASAYVIAKYYWPERALPLLETASRLAQEEQDFGLEHMCRNGAGAVLKQLGSYGESIENYRVALALARKTLDPLAEATTLVNIAVSEMARGNFIEAATQLLKSAAIDNRFPRWAFRVYRFHNHGVLLLLSGEASGAEREFTRALDLSLQMDLWPTSALALAGQALCAQSASNDVQVHERCDAIRACLGGRSKVLHDRWMIEAALAWDALWQGQDVARELRRLEPIRMELRKRDIDSWLRLELEVVRLREAAEGHRHDSTRELLAAEAKRYGAAAMRRDLIAR